MQQEQTIVKVIEGEEVVVLAEGNPRPALCGTGGIPPYRLR